MKAVAFFEHGGPEVLKVTDLPTPDLADDDVLVRVEAAALNHLDLWIRRGMRAVQPPLPHVGSSDVAGVVEKVGPKVRHAKPGDRVVLYAVVHCNACEFCHRGEQSQCVDFGILGEHVWGGLADFVKVPERNLLALPPEFPFEEAAAAALTFQTAWRMLVTKAQVRPGEEVLVLGAGGGVSSAAIQIAKHAGCRVLATTGGADKVRKARELGADVVIDYKATPEWEKEVWALTGKRGVDVVVENVGQATWAKSLRTLRKGGRLVTCGSTTGAEATTDIRQVFWRQLTILGSTMASRSEFDAVMKLVFAGTMRPVIDTRLKFAEARKGHELLERGEHFGKVVLVP